MKWQGQHLRLALLALVSATALLAVGTLPAEEKSQTDHIKIGIVRSVFRDVPETMIALMNQPFNTLMHAQTGMTSDLIKVPDAYDLGRQLTEDKVQLGIFHGVEFGWARLKYPNLKPLMIGINQHRYLKAHIVVRADSEIASLADLKGQQLSVPKCTRPHCLMYLERHCAQECGCGPKDHVAKLVTSPTCEDGLDDVIDNGVEGCLIDGVSLEVYKKRKPGRCAKLKVAVESETFPAGVIAYCPGGLDDAVLERFQSGMKDANKSILGKQLLTLWKLSGFEPVPDDYDQLLTEIVKSYPPPAEKK